MTFRCDRQRSERGRVGVGYLVYLYRFVHLGGVRKSIQPGSSVHWFTKGMTVNFSSEIEELVGSDKIETYTFM